MRVERARPPFPAIQRRGHRDPGFGEIVMAGPTSYWHDCQCPRAQWFCLEAKDARLVEVWWMRLGAFIVSSSGGIVAFPF